MHLRRPFFNPLPFPSKTGKLTLLQNSKLNCQLECVMATTLHKYLGNGLYTLPEAALYARVSTRMMARWLLGSDAGEPVLISQFDPADKVVTFLDFVQTLAIREIRITKKVPLQKIRNALRLAEQNFNLDHPFARQHCAYLLNEELVIAPPGGEYVEVAGSQGQRLFRFVESYLEQLSFSKSGLANLYSIYKSADVQIVMDPKVHFGEPMLPSGYSAAVIWEAIEAEGGLQEAASVYGIPREEVEAAYKFFVNYLGKTAA